MNRILLVSHSLELAEATKRFCKEMLPDNNQVVLDVVGGNDDNGFGNSINKITKKIEEGNFDNTFLIYDLGSAKMIIDLVIKNKNDDSLHMINCSFVEGAFVSYSLINKTSDPKEIIKSIEEQVGINI